MSVSYPYDPSGTESTNLIQNELHSVQPPADITHASFIVPLASPFFKESLEIYTGINKSGTKLIEGTDYFLTHKFYAGSIFLGKLLYGSITWINSNYAGNVYLHYQTLGGAFTVNDVSIVESITNKLYQDIRFVTWDQIQGVPSAFPPDAHQHPVTDIKTLADVKYSLDAIAAALLGLAGGDADPSGALALIINHLQNTSSAHTPAAVGLGNVANYPVASEADAVAIRSDRYVTPTIAAYMINRYIAQQNIGDIRDNVATLQYNLSQLTILVNNIQAAQQQMDNQLQDLELLVDEYRRDNDIIRDNQVLIDQKANLAITIANQALAIANANQSNLELVLQKTFDILYTSTRIFSEGTHRLTIPAGNKLKVTCIGAGAGSGGYYATEAERRRYQNYASDGQDTVLYVVGTREIPVEPFPVLIAGGGRSGENGFLNQGFANGGAGGVAKRLADRIQLSTVVIGDYSDLVTGSVTEAGVNGTTGDTESPNNTVVPGVGGVSINASGDLSTLKYGKGRAGTTRAGLGGSGAKWDIIVDNDTTSDYNLILVVGRGGCSAKSTANLTDNSFESNGAGFATLVE